MVHLHHVTRHAEATSAPPRDATADGCRSRRATGAARRAGKARLGGEVARGPGAPRSASPNELSVNEGDVVLVPAADLAKFGSLVYARKTDGSDREGYVPHKFVREGSRR